MVFDLFSALDWYWRNKCMTCKYFFFIIIIIACLLLNHFSALYTETFFLSQGQISDCLESSAYAWVERWKWRSKEVSNLYPVARLHKSIEYTSVARWRFGALICQPAGCRSPCPGVLKCRGISVMSWKFCVSLILSRKAHFKHWCKGHFLQIINKFLDSIWYFKLHHDELVLSLVQFFLTISEYVTSITAYLISSALKCFGIKIFLLTLKS